MTKKNGIRRSATFRRFVGRNNADLSLRRAEAVVAWLVKNNVNESRMSAVGLGEKTPVTSNLTVHGKALNRRVEIVLPQ